jgi:hypothetical protein
MSSRISIELGKDRLARLRQVARTSGQTPEDTAATLIEEGLRQREFPGIHFRDTGAGRRAFVPGLRVPIYFLALLAREVDNDIATIAEHYAINERDVTVSLDYIRAYADEIERDIAEHEAAEERLLATLPPDQVVLIP